MLVRLILQQGKLAGPLFDNVRWSTKYALSDTQKNLGLGLRVAMLSALADIDDGADYAAWTGTKR